MGLLYYSQCRYSPGDIVPWPKTIVLGEKATVKVHISHRQEITPAMLAKKGQGWSWPSPLWDCQLFKNLYNSGRTIPL